MTSPCLEVRNLCMHYDDGRIEALRGVDLSIAAGEYLAITGPSGSGKVNAAAPAWGAGQSDGRRSSLQEFQTRLGDRPRYLPVSSTLDSSFRHFT